MKRLTIAALAVAALSGCATGKWHHPSKDETQFRQDALECEYDARKATANIRSGFEAGWERGSLERLCMQTRGYEYRLDPK